MRIAVCDDELVAREEIVTCIEDYSHERKLDISYKVYESYLLLEPETDEFDIFIMDYQTPEIDGMTFAEKIREKYGTKKTIIFVTSFKEIVYDSFRVKTHRFLVKPVEKEKFFEALDTCLLTDKENKTIALRSDGFTDVIKADDIYYIEVRGKDCCIFFSDDSIVSRRTISFFEDELSSSGFFRIHRNYLVNMKKIKSFDRSKIELENGVKIDVSSRRYGEFCREYLKLK